MKALLPRFPRFPLRIQTWRESKPYRNATIKFRPECSSAALSSMASTGLICYGERETRYQLVCPLGTQIPLKSPDVWLALDDSRNVEYVIKRPPGDGNDALDGPRSIHRFGKHKNS